MVAGVLERRPPELCARELELDLEENRVTQNGFVWVEPQPELVEETNGKLATAISRQSTLESHLFSWG